MATKKPHWRNIFQLDENEKEWKKVLKTFPNGVPRFQDKASCVAFIKAHCQRGSNPIEPGLTHSISTLTDWDQIENILLPKMIEYNQKYPVQTFDTAKYYKDNIFTPQYNPSGKYIESRLNLCIHKQMTFQSTMNTLRYMYYHLRCGIYVMIRNKEVVIFAPFVNKDFRNNWGDAFKLLSDHDERTKNILPKNGDTTMNDLASDYYNNKRDYFGQDRDNYLKDVSQWWANGNIMCNQHISIEDAAKVAANLQDTRKKHSARETAPSQWWGDSFLLQLKDMIAETCKHRDVPDCEFFINKRDYPNLKFHAFPSEPKDEVELEAVFSQDSPDHSSRTDGAGTDRCVDGVAVEPYGFLFDMDDKNEDEDVVLSRHRYSSYAPILSFYSSARFADIPFPPTEDWEAATGAVFPPSFDYSKDPNSGELSVGAPRDLFTTTNLEKFKCNWEDKVPTAFFRGTATGAGVTVDSNQRLHVSHLSYLWSKNPPKSVSNCPHPYLNAAITGWNSRDKKKAKTSMCHIHSRGFPFKGGKVNFVEIYKQATYKYLIYVEGHCAACRYGFMMRLGSVILKVESSCVADSMWYFPLLQPYVDHVPVKADLSDLQDRIEWCRAHDEECKQIAQRAQSLYDKYLSRNGVLDYMQSVMVQISKNWIRIPEYFDASMSLVQCVSDKCVAKPKLVGSSTGGCTQDGELCAACKALDTRRKNEAAARRKRDFEELSRDKVENEAQSQGLAKRLQSPQSESVSNSGVSEVIANGNPAAPQAPSAFRRLAVRKRKEWV